MIIIFIQIKNNANYIPSINKDITFINIHNIPIELAKKLITTVKNGDILKMQNKSANAIELFQFLTPEDVLPCIKDLKEKKLLDILFFLINNWRFIYKGSESHNFLIDRIEKEIKPEFKIDKKIELDFTELSV